ncbi:MAG: hypothetical protein ACHBNF_00185 [Chromatiales bacterium]
MPDPQPKSSTVPLAGRDREILAADVRRDAVGDDVREGIERPQGRRFRTVGRKAENGGHGSRPRIDHVRGHADGVDDAVPVAPDRRSVNELRKGEGGRNSGSLVDDNGAGTGA